MKYEEYLNLRTRINIRWAISIILLNLAFTAIVTILSHYGFMDRLFYEFGDRSRTMAISIWGALAILAPCIFYLSKNFRLSKKYYSQFKRSA